VVYTYVKHYTRRLKNLWTSHAIKVLIISSNVGRFSEFVHPKIQQRIEINGESTSMVWPTLGSRKAKEQEQNRRFSRKFAKAL